MAIDMITPSWPAAHRVRAVCSLRSGGVSVGAYDSLNLGDHVGDDAQAVARNRELLGQAIGARPVYLKQVHGVQVLRLDEASLDENQDTMEADACVTAQRGLACTIMVADCLPVLLTNRAGTVVGAAHAGWRGLCGQAGVGVLEQIFKEISALSAAESALNAHDSIAAEGWMAWLGPCIGAGAFEVGAEVREAFVAADEQAASCFQPLASTQAGKYLADLSQLARQRLQALGISHIYGNDGSTDWCTVSKPSKFFSHRRDRVSGRFAAAIWLS